MSIGNFSGLLFLIANLKLLATVAELKRGIISNGDFDILDFQMSLLLDVHKTCAVLLLSVHDIKLPRGCKFTGPLQRVSLSW